MSTTSLFLLADARFPAGGHANSAGVEAAVRAGDVVDLTTLERYLRGRLATTGVTDAAFTAYVAALDARDPISLVERVATADAEYEARTLSPRLRDNSRRFGRQLVRAALPVWSGGTLDVVAAMPAGAHQPVALGAAAAAAGAGPLEAATISMHHLLGAVTTAAVRLLGLDPVSVAALQARLGIVADGHAASADHWAELDAADLPAHGGTLTEILGEDHGRWDHRLFVA